MKEEHFERFTLNLEHLVKCITALERDGTAEFGVKGVHTFWIYSLLSHPEGMTAAEIAAKGRVNRSLVSREMDKLHHENIVELEDSKSGRGRYNRRIKLTEKGRQIARRIASITMEIQNRVDEGIGDRELEVFYSVLERLCGNFTSLIEDKKKTARSAQ